MLLLSPRPQVDSPACEKRLFDVLQSRIAAKSKPIYEAASEVMGLVFADEQNRAHVASAANFDRLQQLVLDMFSNKEIDKFLRCTSKIGLHHRAFLTRSIVNKVVFVATSIHGEPLEGAAQLLLWYAEGAAAAAKRNVSGSSSSNSSMSSDQIDPSEFVKEVRPCMDAILRGKNANAQLLVLRMLHVQLNLMAEADLRALLPTLIAFAHEHAVVESRLESFRILMWAFDNVFVAEDESASSSSSSSSSSALSPRARIRSALLRGLDDAAAPLRDLLFQFWNHPTRLEDDPAQRLLALTRQLHSTDCEASWVSYGSTLFLAPCTRSTVYNTAFSMNPLGNGSSGGNGNGAAAPFEDMDIDGSSSGSSSSMVTPMFSHSQQQQQRASGRATAGDSLGSFFGSQLVESTQNNQWTQTQSQAGGGGNGVFGGDADGGVMDSFDPRGLSSDSSSSRITQSSMMFRGSSLSQGGDSMGASGSASMQFSMGKVSSSSSSSSSSSLSAAAAAADPDHSSNLRRRFVKTRETGKSIALRVANDRARYQRIWNQQMMADRRTAKVSLVRRYRKGELPDIQITHADLLKPLLALQSEQSIAALTFSLLFKSFCGTLRASELGNASVRSLLLAPEEATRIRTDLCANVAQMMRASPCESAGFIRTLHDMSRHLDEAATALPHAAFVPAALLADTALRTQSHATAIVVLERQLVQAAAAAAQAQAEAAASSSSSSSSSASTKKRKTAASASASSAASSASSAAASAAESQATWAHLSRLYAALGESDIVLGLHARASTQAVTRQAIGATVAHDFGEALRLYEQATGWLGGDDDGNQHAWDGGAFPPQFEIDLWEDARMDCFRRLAQWDLVGENVLAQVDGSLEQLWQQPAAQRDTLTRLMVEASLNRPQRYLAATAAFVDAALTADGDAAHRRALESSLGAALIAVEVIAHPARAPAAVGRFYERTLQQWAGLSPLAHGARCRLLGELQPAVEASEFHALRVVDVGGGSDRRRWLEQAHTLVAAWTRRLPADESASDAHSPWDAVIGARAHWLTALRASALSIVSSASSAASGSGGGDGDNDHRRALRLLNALERCRVEGLCAAAEAAASVGNLAMAHARVDAARNPADRLDARGSGSVGDDALSFGNQRRVALLSAELDLKQTLLIGGSSASGSVASTAAAAGQAAVHRVRTLYRLAVQIDSMLKLVPGGGRVGNVPNGDNNDDDNNGNGNEDDDSASAAAESAPRLALAVHSLRSRVLAAIADAVEARPTLVMETGNQSAAALWASTRGSHLDAIQAVEQATAAAEQHDRSGGGSNRGSKRQVARAAAAQRLSSSSSTSSPYLARALFAFSSFCLDRIARLQPPESDGASSSSSSSSASAQRLITREEFELASSAVASVFRGIQHGGDASLVSLLPQLVTLLDTHDDERGSLAHAFAAAAAAAPAWIFLRWTAPLLSALGSARVHASAAAAAVLLRLASEYPQAVFFAFQLSAADLEKRNDAAAHRAAPHVQKVRVCFGSCFSTSFSLEFDILFLQFAYIRHTLHRVALALCLCTHHATPHRTAPTPFHRRSRPSSSARPRTFTSLRRRSTRSATRTCASRTCSSRSPSWPRRTRSRPPPRRPWSPTCWPSLSSSTWPSRNR